MKIAVAIGAYNEEKNIAKLLDALLSQTLKPAQIVVTNDGSIDKTQGILEQYAKKHHTIKVFSQKNAGPASARNKAWRNTSKDIDIIAITDGNCTPEPNWLEELVKPFSDSKVGATGGTYKTLNENSLLARFFGMEIAWKYSKIKGEIEAHGTYNLAIRKKVLEEIGGLDERYRKPSGEDWDLTYKISRNYKIIYVPKAIVGTEHPESIGKYLKTQVRRGYDRIMLYNEHPEMGAKDNYTGRLVKYQILLSGAFIPSLIFLLPIFRFSYMIPAAIFLFLLLTSLEPFPYFIKRDAAVALFSIPIQLLRNFAWFIGLVKGVFKFGFVKIVVGVIKSGF